MHAHGFRDVMQHERLHGFRAVVEEGALAVHDRARDLEQRLVSGIQALDEPARLLELVLQVTVVGARIPAVDHLFVMTIDTQIRGDVRIEIGAPHAADFLDDDVGDDIARLRRGDGISRPWVQALDEIDHLLQIFRREFELAS